MNILRDDGLLAEGTSAAAVLTTLAGLRLDHLRGSEAALLEALALRVSATAAGLRISPPWPPAPEDPERVLGLWRAVRGARRGAEKLSRARNAEDVSRGLGDLLGSLVGAELLIGRAA